jgi:hypothetical protein
MKTHINTTKIYKARLIGTFFLLAFMAYGIGRNLLESGSTSEKYIGAILVIANSIMVLLIGAYLRNILMNYSVLAGNIYLFTRAFESIALASLVLNLITTVQISDFCGYFPAMLVLGLGSIPMCFTLYKYKILPTWLAIWGIIGYIAFAFGFLMELFGKQWSMYFLASGALWEITLAIWLIVTANKK